MKNKEIIFWNLEKRELNNIESKAKYIIFTDKDVDINRFNIKPIIIRFHGSLIIDYETNETIFSSKLSSDKIKQITAYALNHNVDYIKNKYNKETYEIQLETTNFNRMLVMPAFIKNEYNGLKTYYMSPNLINNNCFINYVINDDVSVLESLLCIINYLKLKSNDILELTNICFTLVDLISTNGYCMTNKNLKIKNSDLVLLESRN